MVTPTASQQTWERLWRRWLDAKDGEQIAAARRELMQFGAEHPGHSFECPTAPGCVVTAVFVTFETGESLRPPPELCPRGPAVVVKLADEPDEAKGPMMKGAAK